MDSFLKLNVDVEVLFRVGLPDCYGKEVDSWVQRRWVKDCSEEFCPYSLILGMLFFLRLGYQSGVGLYRHVEVLDLSELMLDIKVV